MGLLPSRCFFGAMTLSLPRLVVWVPSFPPIAFLLGGLATTVPSSPVPFFVLTTSLKPALPSLPAPSCPVSVTW